MIYLYDVEEHPETKTVIKKRVPSRGESMGGLTLYTVYTRAGVSLGDFATRRAARSFCKNGDRVRLVQALMALRRMTEIYWSGERTLKRDQFVHTLENDIESAWEYLRKEK